MNSVKGTRDFYPEDLRVRNWLFKHWREISHVFAFEEYDAPVLEYSELYTLKNGETYNFVDKGGRNLTMRPEMTPTLVRMILKKGNKMRFPIKWFSIPQCWRYEETQKGRKREHYQWNCDILGVPDVNAEAELLSMLYEFLRRIGLRHDIFIKVNNRKIFQAVLKKFGVEDAKFIQVCDIVDKGAKSSPEETTITQLINLEIKPETAQKIVEYLRPGITLDKIEDIIDKCSAIDETRRLFELCEAYNIQNCVRFDPSVVRGLNYYTGIVFEVFDKSMEFRAIAGGGRYDNLFRAKQVRSAPYGDSEGIKHAGARRLVQENIPACGFGMGDCVVIELLKSVLLLPVFVRVVDYCVIPEKKSDTSAAIELTRQLRFLGKATELILSENKSLKWMYSHADKIRAAFGILVTGEEVRIKNLQKSGSQIIIKKASARHVISICDIEKIEVLF